MHTHGDAKAMGMVMAIGMAMTMTRGIVMEGALWICFDMGIWDGRCFGGLGQWCGGGNGGEVLVLWDWLSLCSFRKLGRNFGGLKGY